MDSFLQAQQLPNRETIVSPFAHFSSNSANMTLSDGRTAILRVGDIVNLKDDHQYRVLKIFAPSGPIVSNALTAPPIIVSYELLTTLSSALLQWSIGLHKLTPPPSSATDDPLAASILQCCGPDAVDAYHQGRPYCLGDVHWVTLLETIKGDPI